AVIVFTWAALTLLIVHVAASENRKTSFTQQRLVRGQDSSQYFRSLQLGWYHIELVECSIKGELGSLNFSCFSSLQYINLWNNDLSGSIPPQIGSLSKLKYLNLRWKNLTELFQTELFDKLFIQKLVFSIFTIPLRHTVPKTLRPMCLDMSFNNLEGEILTYLRGNPPKSFVGNKGLCQLCGPVKGFPSCSQRHRLASSFILSVKIFLPLTLVLAFTVFVFILLLKSKSENPKLVTRAATNGDVLSVWNYDAKILYEDLIDATEDFHIKYCIVDKTFNLPNIY
ncbi:hypothetical protein CUMW_196250, partial [Citrus unshiu]